MAKPKFTRKELLLFLIPVAIIFPFYSPWRDDIRWVFNQRKEKMERIARRLSGWGAKDCGRTTAIDYTQEINTDSCAIAAFKARQSFRVRYDYQGRDDPGSISMIGRSSGELYVLRTDIFGQNRVTQITILHPRIETIEGEESLSLESAVRLEIH